MVNLDKGYCAYRKSAQAEKIRKLVGEDHRYTALFGEHVICICYEYQGKLLLERWHWVKMIFGIIITAAVRNISNKMKK